MWMEGLLCLVLVAQTDEENRVLYVPWRFFDKKGDDITKLEI